MHLHEALKKGATSPDELGSPPAELRTSSRVLDVDPHTATVTLENGDKVQGDLVIAADGVHVSVSPYFLKEETEKIIDIAGRAEPSVTSSFLPLARRQGSKTSHTYHSSTRCPSRVASRISEKFRSFFENAGPLPALVHALLPPATLSFTC